MSNPEVYEVEVYPNGDRYWSQNGNVSRLDGPAVEHADGDDFWYIDGVEYTEAKFIERTQPKPTKELTVAEISKLLGYEVKVVKG